MRISGMLSSPTWSHWEGDGIPPCLLYAVSRPSDAQSIWLHQPFTIAGANSPQCPVAIILKNSKVYADDTPSTQALRSVLTTSSAAHPLCHHMLDFVIASATTNPCTSLPNHNPLSFQLAGFKSPIETALKWMKNYFPAH